MPSQIISGVLELFFNAQCARVTVRLLVTRITVLIKGNHQASIASVAVPPGVINRGQVSAKSGHSSK